VAPFAGTAATGRRIVVEGCSVNRVADSVVVSHNSTLDWPGAMGQLGVPGMASWPARVLAWPAAPSAGPDLEPAAADRARATIARDLRALRVTGTTGGAPARGASTLDEEFTVLRAAFPDLEVTGVTTVAEGGVVGLRATLRGTHRGALRGVAPTGREIAFDHFGVCRVDAGPAGVAAYDGLVAWTLVLARLGAFPE
jgi:hypothetical protein